MTGELHAPTALVTASPTRDRATPGCGPDTRAHTAAHSAGYSRLMAAEMATARVTPA